MEIAGNKFQTMETTDFDEFQKPKKTAKPRLATPAQINTTKKFGELSYRARQNEGKPENMNI